MNASDQVQEYLEGMKIIKSCGLSGVHFKSLDNALLATPAMEGKEKEVSNCDIELSHVTFAYNQENVIKDTSCKIPQGSVTALVGPSGSGESTISKLIARFWDIQKYMVKYIYEKFINRYLEKKQMRQRRYGINSWICRNVKSFWKRC